MFINILARVGRLILKEMLATLRDPKARIVLVLPPIIQVFIFSYAITQEVRNAPMAVLNRDTGIEGAALLKYMGRQPTFRNMFHVRNEQEIDTAIDQRKATAVMVIPPDFTRRLADSSPCPAQINLILDGRRPNASPILAGYIQRIVQNALLGSLREKGGHPSAIPGIDVVTRHWFNPNLIPRQSFLPGLICILCAVVGLNLSALAIARERELGTFEQLLVSPLTLPEILFGKAFTVVFLTSMTAGVLVVIIHFFFGITIKSSPFLFVVSIETFLLAIVGVGLFVSSLSMTQQQAILGAILVLPPATMLSGFATPIENMPGWLQMLTVANPLRWFLIIVKGLFMRGMSAAAVCQNLIPLFVISAVTLTSAAYMFRKRME